MLLKSLQSIVIKYYSNLPLIFMQNSGNIGITNLEITQVGRDCQYCFYGIFNWNKIACNISMKSSNKPLDIGV